MSNTQIILTKEQEELIGNICKSNNITSFSNLYRNQPAIGLDVFNDRIWLTQECETGRNIGVHVSCKSDDEVIDGWSGMGWVIYGRKFVEKLAKEIKMIMPEFTDFDNLTYEKNTITFK